MILCDLLASRSPNTSLGGRIVGYVFLSIAILGGTFFLFQGIVPLLGYLESGAIVCSLLGVIGGLLIFMTRKKKPLQQEDLSHQALSFFKDLHIEKMLKDNAVSIALLSLGVGFALSQLNNPNKLLEIYKKLIR